MSGGGKGGKQTTQVQIPKWLEDAGKGALAQGQEISKIGYMPHYGPDVAALTQPQLDAMGNTNAAASAFGLGSSPAGAGLPDPQVFDGGVRGYSSGSLFDQAVAELQQRRPGQYDQLMKQFVDPFQAQPQQPQQPVQPPASPWPPAFSNLGYWRPGGEARNRLLGK